MDKMQQGPAVPVNVARHVLWLFGDSNLGEEPGSFVQALMVAIQRADEGNRAKLGLGFSQYVLAVDAAQRQSWGMDWLRGIVKRALDEAAGL